MPAMVAMTATRDPAAAPGTGGAAPQRTAAPAAVTAARPYTGAHALCEALTREGIELIFGYPGGAVIPLYDVLTQYPNLRHVLVRHEQWAAHAAARLIAAAERPVVMAGHGITISGATEEFRRFVERADLPVAFTLHGLGTLPASHPLAIGFMGMHGHVHVNRAIDNCDLLINIGARFDDRATGRVDAFAPKATVIHVDVDPAEIGKNVHTDVPIVGDAKHVLQALLKVVDEADRSAWRAEIDAWRVPPPAARAAGRRATRD